MQYPSFYQWLVHDGKELDARYNDLYKDAKRSDFPKHSKEFLKIYNYLYMKGACTSCMETFKDAYWDYINSLYI